MIGGPNDSVITPWQSAQLGFYDQNETVIPFEKQQVSVGGSLHRLSDSVRHLRLFCMDS